METTQDENLQESNKYVTVNIPLLSTITKVGGKMKDDSEFSDTYRTVKLKPLSEIQKSEGWINVLPNATRTNIVEISVNYAQVPEHLLHKVKRQYNRDASTNHYKVNDKCFQYRIYLTEVDTEIKELISEVKSHAPNFHRIKELLEIMGENDIYGWVTIRANLIVNKQMCWVNIMNGRVK